MGSLLQKIKFIFAVSLLFFGFFIFLFSDNAYADVSANVPSTVTTNCINLSGIGAGSWRVRNNSGYNYFVPFRTIGEWNAFKTYIPANVSALDCCNYNPPSSVRTLAAFFTDHDCGHTPGCALNSLYTNIGESNAGATCGFSGRWRAVQCAALFHPSSICEGDPCITGIDHASYGWPQYCYGHYDNLVGACVYDGKTAQLNSPNGTITYARAASGGVSVGASIYSGETAVNPATWGGCYTQAACGNGVCSPSYGETCSNCASDCGACPQVCGDYNCSGTETCGNCPQDCGACLCYNFTDSTSCADNGCTWNWGSSTCGSTCGNYYNELDCQQGENCTWDYYNYTCKDKGSYCYYYDQYSCQSAGCAWNPYNSSCN